MTTPKDRAELLDLLVKADATASVYSTHIQQEESRLATLGAAGLAVIALEPTEEMANAVYLILTGDESEPWLKVAMIYKAIAASPYREKE